MSINIHHRRIHVRAWYNHNTFKINQEYLRAFICAFLIALILLFIIFGFFFFAISY